MKKNREEKEREGKRKMEKKPDINKRAKEI